MPNAERVTTYLLSESQTTEEEAHAENEQQVGQDGPKKGSLDNADLILGQGNDENDEFDCVTKGDVEKGAEGITHLTGDGLGGKAQKTSERDNGDAVDGKDYAGVDADVCDNNADGYEDEEKVHPAVLDYEPEGAMQLLGEGPFGSIAGLSNGFKVVASVAIAIIIGVGGFVCTVAVGPGTVV